MSNLKIVKAKENLAQKAGEVLTRILKESPEAPKLFLISAGSSFKVLDFVEIDLAKNLTIAVLDERFSKDPDVNNFSQLSRTDFFKEVLENDIPFIDTKVGEKETITHLKVRFQEGLKKWKKENPKGEIVALVGIGEDGHTAGVMAFPENDKFFEDLFCDKDEWVVAYDAKGKHKYALRVTVSLDFLRNKVDKAIIFISGENKKEALEKVLRDEGNLHEIPGRVIQEMKDVVLFTNVEI